MGGIGGVRAGGGGSSGSRPGTMAQKLAQLGGGGAGASAPENQGTLDERLGAAYGGAGAGEGEGEGEGEAGAGAGEGEGEGEAGAGAGEGEGEGEAGAGAGAGAGEGEGEGEEEGIKDGEIPNLSAEVQATVNGRIGKEVGRRKAAEEGQQSAEVALEVAEGKVTAAEERLNDQGRAEAVTVGIHPDYGTKEDIALVTRYEALTEAEDFLIENSDEGYVGNGTDADPAYTAKQLKRRLVEVRRELRGVAPRAVAVQDRILRQEHEDMKAGRELRLKTGTKPAKTTPAKKPAKRPVVPKVPGGGTQSRRPVVKSTEKSGFDIQKVMENPSPESLEEAYGRVL